MLNVKIYCFLLFYLISHRLKHLIPDFGFLTWPTSTLLSLTITDSLAPDARWRCGCEDFLISSDAVRCVCSEDEWLSTGSVVGSIDPVWLRLGKGLSLETLCLNGPAAVASNNVQTTTSNSTANLSTNNNYKPEKWPTWIVHYLDWFYHSLAQSASNAMIILHLFVLCHYQQLEYLPVVIYVANKNSCKSKYQQVIESLRIPSWVVTVTRASSTEEYSEFCITASLVRRHVVG